MNVVILCTEFNSQTKMIVSEVKEKKVYKLSAHQPLRKTGTQWAERCEHVLSSALFLICPADTAAQRE